MKNVLFRYGAGEPEVLRNVNMVVEPGEMIALIGPSGGGKTTLLKVMMGLFEPTLGQVLVDGTCLTNLGLTHWRKQIGTVAQDDMLFAGTIAENIAFFDPEIDMERVLEVSRLVGLHDDIQRMPMRYDSLVGDMGSALSGGQRQRLFLARALYPDPAILFIDEGTAHLDPMSEQTVMHALRRLPITRIVSAHRPLPVQAADKVYLVRDGTASLIPNDLGHPKSDARQSRAASGERQPQASLG